FLWNKRCCRCPSISSRLCSGSKISLASVEGSILSATAKSALGHFMIELCLEGILRKERERAVWSKRGASQAVYIDWIPVPVLIEEDLSPSWIRKASAKEF